ncbi:hypothetical protein TNCV_5080181 [Trichonephila clavipes]|nr:hypothetical protein TNCV_5080181 [Trichonephila clavipes]
MFNEVQTCREIILTCDYWVSVRSVGTSFSKKAAPAKCSRAAVINVYREGILKQCRFKLISSSGCRKSTGSLGTGESKFINRKSGLVQLIRLPPQVSNGSTGTVPKEKTGSLRQACGHHRLLKVRSESGIAKVVQKKWHVDPKKFATPGIGYGSRRPVRKPLLLALTRTSLVRKGWTVDDKSWPAQSPDLNPFENLRDEIKRASGCWIQHHPILKVMESAIHEIWPQIPCTIYQQLVKFMPRKIHSILWGKGVQYCIEV